MTEAAAAHALCDAHRPAWERACVQYCHRKVSCSVLWGRASSAEAAAPGCMWQAGSLLQCLCVPAELQRVESRDHSAAVRHGSLQRHWLLPDFGNLQCTMALGPFWKPLFREEMRTVHSAFCVHTTNPNSHPMTKQGDTRGDVLTYLQPLPWTVGRTKVKKPWWGHGPGEAKTPPFD